MAKLRETISRWRSPVGLMFVLTAAMAVAMGTYHALLNNFTVERAGFTGQDIWLDFISMSSPSAVFLVGAGLAALSLFCIQMVPRNPSPDNEVKFFFRRERSPAVAE
jgi:hypothetical protein